MDSNGDGTFSMNPDILLCTLPGGELMHLHLEVECPTVSSSGNWRLIWTLSHDIPECNLITGEIDAYSVECDETSFKICWGPIGGIPSATCCGGGVGNGSWDICMESS